MKKIFPELIMGDTNTIEDGTVIEALPYCKKNCNKNPCLTFYHELAQAECGFYICPKGLSVYVTKLNNTPVIYTSMRIKGHYRKKESHKLDKQHQQREYFSPAINENFFLRLKCCDTLVSEQAGDIDRTKNIHAELFHDVRKICAHIKNKSEDIISPDEDIEVIAKMCDTFDILQKVKNIEALSGIATSRFEVYDISMNPATMCYGKRRNRVIYKKFHKAKYMLINYMDKNIQINLLGQSTFSYPVYQTFDTLPFILLENAVKYAPSNSGIEILFREEYNNLYVSVISEGPSCREDEIPLLCEKGFRASTAKQAKTTGSGVGLNLAKEICEAHGIKMNIKSHRTHYINRIPYGKFEVNLSFFNDLSEKTVQTVQRV